MVVVAPAQSCCLPRCKQNLWPYAAGFLAPTVARSLDNTRLTADVGRSLMSTRVFNHDGRFFEAGRIYFPDIDSHLDVDTPDPARAYPRPDGSSYGAATWRIRGGGGRFAGAHGLVT